MKRYALLFGALLAGLEGGRVAEYRGFAQGWLQGERAWGRPADVEVGPDGALYVSDDAADVVYRIGYRR